MFDCVNQLGCTRRLIGETANKEPWLKELKRFVVTEVCTDTDATLLIAVNEQASAELKHILLKFHFFKD